MGARKTIADAVALCRCGGDEAIASVRNEFAIKLGEKNARVINQTTAGGVSVHQFHNNFEGEHKQKRRRKKNELWNPLWSNASEFYLEKTSLTCSQVYERMRDGRLQQRSLTLHCHAPSR